ncbi:MAG: CapA family protein [Candidatus Moraniibacteriota bacterium]
MKKQFIIPGLFIVFILILIIRTGLVAYSQKETTSLGVVSFNSINEETVEILFLGDSMLDRYIRNIVQRKGVDFLTENVRQIFLKKDVIVTNLEGPVTSQNSVSSNALQTEKNHFIFTFDPKTTKAFLGGNRINLVSLGNNHTLNFKEEGLLETETNLKSFGVDYFGSPMDENNFLIKEINGIKIGFVNYNQFSKITSDKVIQKIKEIKKQVSFVIVYTHWGEEYETVENEKQRNLAHLFVDSGADLIIGSHPHVIQPIEIYKNKAIFYSLGNFVFDQYFSEDVKNRLAVGVSLSKEKIDFYLEVLHLNSQGQLILADEQKRNLIFERLSQHFIPENEEKKAIMGGKFTILNN